MITVGYDNGSWTATVLNYEKHDISIEETFDDFLSIIGFLKANDNIPIILSIRDKAVLYVTSKDIFTNETVPVRFEEEVPNARIEDFVIDYTDGIMAFTRMNFVKELILAFEAFEKQIINLSLAPTSGFSLAYAKSIVNPSDTIEIGGYAYSFKEGLFSAISESTAADFEIEGQVVEAKHVLSFSAAVGFIGAYGQQLGIPAIHHNYSELFFKKLIKKIQMPVLGFLLILFLVNGIAFIQFDNQNRELADKSSNLQLLNQKLKNINIYINENEYVLNLMGKEKEFSILCDQVGTMVPSQIKLNQLILKPVETAKGKKVGYIQDQLMLEGESKTAQAFSQWIGTLEKAPWVASIVRQNYVNKVQSNGDGHFEILIRTNVEGLK